MIISIVARKGGSGKTTTAANLAAWLAGAGYVTVGIDLDPQGNLAAAFGIDPAGCGAAGWLNGAGLGSCLVSSRRDRLSLVPADQGIIAAEIGAIASYSPLLAASERLRADVALIGADFVIIDSPTRGALQDLAILAADLVILPAPCDFLGVNAAYESGEVVRGAFLHQSHGAGGVGVAYAASAHAVGAGLVLAHGGRSRSPALAWWRRGAGPGGGAARCGSLRSGRLLGA